MEGIPEKRKRTETQPDYSFRKSGDLLKSDTKPMLQLRNNWAIFFIMHRRICICVKFFKPSSKCKFKDITMNIQLQ